MTRSTVRLYAVLACVGLLLVFVWTRTSTQNDHAQALYVCPPCNLECDALTFETDGICPHCKMHLIMNPEATVLNDIKLMEGSGHMLIEGGEGRKAKTIRVFYHRPKPFNRNSRVIIVLHGAGRNAHDYRDAWVKASEKYNVLVLAPQYSEKAYPQFWNYNLAGMLKDVKIAKDRTAMTDFTINPNPKDWIFNDFDRLFEAVKNALQLNANTYDMFGHSAGGQVLHRLAIFRPHSKADRILAANSGWYTALDSTAYFPVGLKNSGKTSEQMDFSTNLVLFLGKEDDAKETRGDLRHTPELDQQGTHRLARGTYFYKTSKRIAEDLGKTFNWDIEVIPGIGHDYVAMSEAAAVYLYDIPKR